jgi:hypothetical protein
MVDLTMVYLKATIYRLPIINNYFTNKFIKNKRREQSATGFNQTISVIAL